VKTKYHGISQLSPRPISEYAGVDNSAPDEPAEWRRVGSQFTACEDPMFPVDKSIVRAIRELDPDFVPLWVYTEHVSPSGGRAVRCHHAIAWRLRDPHKKHQERQILWPCSPGAVNYGMGGYPMYVEQILQGESDAPVAKFKPLSWQDYEAIRYGIWWQRNEMPSTPEQEAAQAIAAEEARKAREEKRIMDEIEYRFDHESKGVGRHLDQIGSADIKAWGAPREDKKPFVEVHNR
jgi:hypothetical protein